MLSKYARLSSSFHVSEQHKSCTDCGSTDCNCARLYDWEEIKSNNEYLKGLSRRSARAGPTKSCREIGRRLKFLNSFEGALSTNKLQYEWASFWYDFKECAEILESRRRIKVLEKRMNTIDKKN